MKKISFDAEVERLDDKKFGWFFLRNAPIEKIRELKIDVGDKVKIVLTKED